MNALTAALVALASLASLASAALSSAPPAAEQQQLAARAPEPSSSEDRETGRRVYAFDVYRKGEKIGEHRVTVSRIGEDRYRAEVTIDLEVKLAFIPVYTYTHRAEEIVENGRLVSLESRTDDNGEIYEVRARREGDDRLLVEGPAGRMEITPDIVPTTYWRDSLVRSNRLLDTQKGRILNVQAEPEYRGSISIHGREVPATRYSISGDLQLQIWYDHSGTWSKLRFDYKGETLEYRASRLPT